MILILQRYLFSRKNSEFSSILFLPGEFRGNVGRSNVNRSAVRDIARSRALCHHGEASIGRIGGCQIGTGTSRTGKLFLEAQFRSDF